MPEKGASKAIKAGTKVKNIRLTCGDHNIDCKVEGFGAMGLPFCIGKVLAVVSILYKQLPTTGDKVSAICFQSRMGGLLIAPVLALSYDIEKQNVPYESLDRTSHALARTDNDVRMMIALTGLKYG